MVFNGRRKDNAESRWRSVHKDETFEPRDRDDDDRLTPPLIPETPVERPFAYEHVATQPLKPGPTAAEKCPSVVSSGSEWQGTLKVDGSVRIEGRLSGEVDAKDTVHVMAGAELEARVRAAFVVIAGGFDGQIICSERVELMPTSRTRGEVETKSLTVHEGAYIDGKIHMTTEELLPQKAPQTDRVASPSRQARAGSPPAPDPLEGSRLFGAADAPVRSSAAV